ncbi:MAG TPA: ATP-binding protein [Chthoniobacterales bacterium]|jgi:two-component system phosphate regulon sensor histidine kinase PhoR|nr:ATP-binding protein [Chthoniobacterales bacterium]HEV3242994.1 ATP-binding protein [Chthoniobacterales bacterium]
MSWILLFAVVGSTIAIVYLVRRKWILPWREMEQLVKQVGRGEQPRTFLIDGSGEARRVGVALEEILTRQRKLDRQIGERQSGQKAILSAMQDGLLVVDAQSRLALVNPAFCDLFAIDQDSLGSPLLETVRDPAVQRIVGETLTQRKPGQGELMIGRRDFEITSVPMGADNGAATGAVVLFHDITALKRADEIRRDFVANVSHELRTPLSILRGYIETMLDDPKMPRGETARILEVMDQHSKRLGLLANDLLTLAQLESGSSSIQLGEIDLLRLLSDLVRDWKKKFATKGLEAVVDVSDDCSIIRADEERLREILDNLLDNAVKYSGKGDKIRLGAQRRDGEIALSVSDTGVGISQEDLPRIFERFYRADKARSRELGGTGLGLSIVKHIAQLHGGRVEADSEVGKGTTIRVIFPIAG